MSDDVAICECFSHRMLQCYISSPAIIYQIEQSESKRKKKPSRVPCTFVRDFDELTGTINLHILSDNFITYSIVYIRYFKNEFVVNYRTFCEKVSFSSFFPFRFHGNKIIN